MRRQATGTSLAAASPPRHHLGPSTRPVVAEARRMDMGQCMYTIRSCYRLPQWACARVDTMRDDDCLLPCDASRFVEASGDKSMLS